MTRMLVTIDQIGQGSEKEEAFDMREAEDKLKKRFGERIKYCCIGRERHQEKGWHMHIFIHFSKRVKVNLEKNLFFFMYNKPANIQMVKNKEQDKIKALSYVRKTGDFLEFGERTVNLSKQKIGNIKSYVTKAIFEGTSIKNLITHEVEKVREYTLNNSKKIRTMIKEVEEIKLAFQAEAKQGLAQIECPEEWRVIAQAINEASNMKYSRPRKTLNLHLWSPEPNMGKTSLVDKIRSLAPCYTYPPDGWFKHYENEKYHFIIWDETSLKDVDLTFLNLFLEGAHCEMPVKGDKTIKWDNPLVIMLSNKALEKHVARRPDKETVLKTLKARIQEVKLTNPLFDFLEYFKPRNI